MTPSQEPAATSAADDSTEVPDPRVANSLVLGTTELRALAHPVRIRLLGLLREAGPSTATILAGQLGLTSGATSYHLRQLAAVGLVEEDHGRGNARDRWWRSAHRATYFDPFQLPDSEQSAGAVYMDSIAAQYAERLRTAATTYLDLPAAWRQAGDLSDFRLRLTPEQSEAVVRELHAVVARYRRADKPGDPPAGSEVVVVQTQVMPQLGASAARRDVDASQPVRSSQGDPR